LQKEILQQGIIRLIRIMEQLDQEQLNQHIFQLMVMTTKELMILMVVIIFKYLHIAVWRKIIFLFVHG